MKNTSHDMLNKDETESWQRFERAVDVAIKGGPKHKVTPKAKARPTSKGRVHKGKTGH
jgi:hypothetical protein